MTTTNSKYILTDDNLDYYVNKWCRHNDIHTISKLESQGRKPDFIGFWGDEDYMSNFYPNAHFKAQLPDGSWHEFDYSEQYFMHQKALTFNDSITDSEILTPGQKPYAYKKLGRKVQHFNENTWNTVSYEAMFKACFHKFIQNDDICSKLIQTKDAVLVECSPFDRIWGIWMAQEDEKGNPLPWRDYKNWRGENRLGFILMDVRDAIKDFAYHNYMKQINAIENMETGDDYE